jgi:two-component system sensor kinase FixL
MLDHLTEALMAKARDDDSEQARLLIAGRLVRAVAHNLRQPLMALEMNLATILKLTKRDPLDAALVADAIQDAHLAGRRMAVSLQALEDLATPRRRRHEPMDVAGIVREVARLVGSNAKLSRVRIETEIEPELPALVGDSAMVGEALLSLVLSAVDSVLAPVRSSKLPRDRSPVIVAARRDGSAHVAIVVEHPNAPGHELVVDDESSWDTSIARAALTLHSGSLSIEHDAGSSRATMRWPLRGD